MGAGVFGPSKRQRKLFQTVVEPKNKIKSSFVNNNGS